MPDLAEYRRRWSALHGGVPPTGLVGGWLAGTHAVARPLAKAGLSPDAVTLCGLLLAVLALPPAAAGGQWLLLAAAAVVASALLDGLDGAVAVLTDRVSGRGFVLDSVCDRVSDACYVGALWLAGAPGELCVAGGAIAWLHEYVRARAAAGGMAEVGVVSVSERPTRVVVTAMFLLAGAVQEGRADDWAAAGAAAWTTLGAIGFVQLVVAVRHRLGST